MNTEYTSPSQGKSFIPLTLISISLIIFFSWQLYVISVQKANLSDAKQKQEENANANEARYQELVGKFRQIQDGLQKVAVDLIDVAKGGDKEAQLIVAKWKIEQQQPNPAAPVTAPGTH